MCCLFCRALKPHDRDEAEQETESGGTIIEVRLRRGDVLIGAETKAGFARHCRHDRANDRNQGLANAAAF